MKFSELEGITRQLIADEVSASDVDPRDLLVSSTTMGLYMTLAEQEFCRKTGYLRDSTGTLTQVDTVIDSDVVVLDEKILQIYDVRESGMPLTHNRALGTYRPVITTSSKPTEYATDLRQSVLMLNVPSDIVYNLVLTVWRLPANAITGRNPNQVPEIPDQWHLALCHWVCARVFASRDEELNDNGAIDKHLAFFNEFAVEGKRFFQRLTEGDSATQVRVGNNGFSWTP